MKKEIENKNKEVETLKVKNITSEKVETVVVSPITSILPKVEEQISKPKVEEQISKSKVEEQISKSKVEEYKPNENDIKFIISTTKLKYIVKNLNDDTLNKEALLKEIDGIEENVVSEIKDIEKYRPVLTDPKIVNYSVFNSILKKLFVEGARTTISTDKKTTLERIEKLVGYFDDKGR